MSDSEKILSGNIYYSRLLNGLDETIKNWSLEPLTGIGLIRGINGKYAHVELEISNHFNNSKTNKIIYKISENQLPIEYRVEIERTLRFFIDYLNSLKSDNFQLKFTILDATYHPVDSRPIDYQNAIMKAIANCFGKSFKPISKVDKKIINDCKHIALKQID
tara:strand:+ start:60 stop:545 length:486 start_codon:yes stop_codon:yes gene_type:complete